MTQELGRFLQAFWLELPKAAAGLLTGKADEAAVNDAGWRAYDAFVSLANETTNLFYADPVVGSMTGQVIERALQIQRVTSTATSAFFGNLWPAIGLPTATEVASLRNQIAALHAELSDDARASATEPYAAPGLAPLHGDAFSLLRNGRVIHGIRRTKKEDAAA